MFILFLPPRLRLSVLRGRVQMRLRLRGEGEFELELVGLRVAGVSAQDQVLEEISPPRLKDVLLFPMETLVLHV